MSDQLDQCKADMSKFLYDYEWGETLTRQRSSTTYDLEGKAAQVWTSNVMTFSGDYQPLNGADIRAESGRTDKSDGKIFFDYNDDILSGDRILRGTSTYWHVNYIKDHEDHQVAYVRKLRNG